MERKFANEHLFKFTLTPLSFALSKFQDQNFKDLSSTKKKVIILLLFLIKWYTFAFLPKANGNWPPIIQLTVCILAELSSAYKTSPRQNYFLGDLNAEYSPKWIVKVEKLSKRERQRNCLTKSRVRGIYKPSIEDQTSQAPTIRQTISITG